MTENLLWALARTANLAATLMVAWLALHAARRLNTLWSLHDGRRPWWPAPLCAAFALFAWGAIWL